MGENGKRRRRNRLDGLDATMSVNMSVCSYLVLYLMKPLLNTLSNYGLRIVLTKSTTRSNQAHKEVIAFIHCTTSLTGIYWLGISLKFGPLNNSVTVEIIR